jgi:23S rRNA (adenine2503-C2)-methyltransferase
MHPPLPADRVTCALPPGTHSQPAELTSRTTPSSVDADRRSQRLPAGLTSRPRSADPLPPLARGAAARHRRSSRIVVEPLDIPGLTRSELEGFARARLARGHGAAGAIYRAALEGGAFEPERHGLSTATCDAWRRNFRLEAPRIARVERESAGDGVTVKLVLRLRDDLECESVLLPMGPERTTLCVSSQVGCKMGCTFCETGRMGLLRNLSADEIVGQVIAARALAGDGAANRDGERAPPPLRNLVFMGMGEALDNFDAVHQALRVLTDTRGLAFSPARITVCTVGHVAGIRRLQQAGWKRLNLSVSLNAPDDALRARLMPIARRHPLAELQQALAEYRPRSTFVLGVNYCLLPGINDAREHAAGVARFCAGIPRVMVNVIPYNPGHAPLTRKPSELEVEQFLGWLRDEGVPVRRRVTKGQSVMAACGQLGNFELRQARRASRAAESKARD